MSDKKKKKLGSTKTHRYEPKHVDTLTLDNVRDRVNEIIGRDRLIPIRYDKVNNLTILRAELLSLANGYAHKSRLAAEALEYINTLRVEEVIRNGE